MLAKALDRAGYLLTLARLSILDHLAGMPPETPADAAIRERGEHLQEGSPKSISTIPAATRGEHLDFATASVGSPRVPSWGAFGRRPSSAHATTYDGPASETLHLCRPSQPPAGVPAFAPKPS
jgi:hypothetical protein